MDVLSVRLGPEEIRHIKAIAKKEKVDQSQAARELINEGWKFSFLRKYKEGRISLGSLAKELGMPLSLSIDFLETLGIAAPLEYEDYLTGLDALKQK